MGLPLLCVDMFGQKNEGNVWFGQPHASLVPKTKMKSIIQKGGISHRLALAYFILGGEEKRVAGSVRGGWAQQIHPKSCHNWEEKQILEL